MANYLYTTNFVDEAPFSWGRLGRWRISRGISVQEVSPGVYEEVRYYAYTDELGAVNLPQVEPALPQYPLPSAGLHFFRGGYEHMVDDAVKANLIASGVATESNFELIP